MLKSSKCITNGEVWHECVGIRAGRLDYVGCNIILEMSHETNFLSIGAPRAGSTWIARNIGQHPDIYVHREKELHFFDLHYEKGIQYYEELFSDWSGESAVGKVTPAHFYKPNVAPLINEHFPNMKLIVSLRNRVERAYSH
jgi:hypothetical protein